MSQIKVVSFDLEGTLVTPDFSLAVWYGGIPSLYAARHGVSLEHAEAEVRREYEKVSEKYRKHAPLDMTKSGVRKRMEELGHAHEYPPKGGK